MSLRMYSSWVMCLSLALLTAVNGLVSDTSNIRTKTMRTVCLVYFESMVYCDEGQNPDTFSGYDVELFRKAAKKMADKGYTEWEPDKYTMACTGWDKMMADLLLPKEERMCDVGVAGIDITTERISAGIQFTFPTYKSGRYIMIAGDTSDTIFGFLEPFDKVVWLTIFATTVVVGVAVLLAEVPIFRLVRSPGPAMEKYFNLQWASTAMMLQAVQQFSVKSVGGRIIILGYAFMVLIIVNMYIAVLSSQLTITSINLSVSGLSDLGNKPVGIFEGDVEAFQRFNLNTHPLPWNTAEDEAVMLQKLRSQEVSALILDAPFVEFTTSKSCDLHLVGELLLPSNLAFAFPYDVSLDYVDQFNAAIVLLEEEGTKEELRQQLVTSSRGCSSKSASTDLSNAQITVHKVAGLWVFLGAAIGLGFVINVASYLRSRWNGEDDNGKPVSASRNNQGRTQSFFQSNPDLSWVNVGDASTTEEALEVLEGHVRTIDARLKRIGSTLDHRFVALQEALTALAHAGKGSFSSQASHVRGNSSESLVSLHNAPSTKPSLVSFALDDEIKAAAGAGTWPRADSAADAIPGSLTLPGTP